MRTYRTDLAAMSPVQLATVPAEQRDELALTEFRTVPVADWHPAFGTLSEVTRGVIFATFTPEELARLRFATYLARRYEINEGMATTADEIVTVPA